LQISKTSSLCHTVLPTYLHQTQLKEWRGHRRHYTYHHYHHHHHRRRDHQQQHRLKFWSNLGYSVFPSLMSNFPDAIHFSVCVVTVRFSPILIVLVVLHSLLFFGMCYFCFNRSFSRFVIFWNIYLHGWFSSI
jgi:hypothetical protein